MKLVTLKVKKVHFFCRWANVENGGKIWFHGDSQVFVFNTMLLCFMPKRYWTLKSFSYFFSLTRSMMYSLTWRRRGHKSALWKRNRGSLIRFVRFGVWKIYPVAEMLTMRVFVPQLLAEEKAISEKNAVERDNAERDARQNETKVCVTNNFC